MPDFKVELSGDDVNRAIADAIIKSVLGDSVIRMTKDYIEKSLSTYDSPVKNMIAAEVRAIVATVVSERAEQIKERVRVELQDQLLGKLVDDAVKSITARLY